MFAMEGMTQARVKLLYLCNEQIGKGFGASILI